jgi:hypothetical protein
MLNVISTVKVRNTGHALHAIDKDMMDTSPGESHLLDLTEVPLDQLRSLRTEHEPYRLALINQVEKPRVNIGTGPPGRAD